MKFSFEQFIYRVDNYGVVGIRPYIAITPMYLDKLDGWVYYTSLDRNERLWNGRLVFPR